MLKEKLQSAVAELKKVYTNVLVRPGSGEGEIDITIDLKDSRNGAAERVQALEIIKASGLKAHGFVASQQCSKIFLRNIHEVAPSSTLPAPSESQQ